MKKRSVLLLIGVLLVLFALLSCGIKRETAKDTAEAFLLALEEARYADAAALFHPSYARGEEDIRAAAERLEQRLGVSLSEGVSVKRYGDFSSSYYDSDVDGSDYEMEITVLIGNRTVELELTVVRNDAGYGISEAEFDTGD